MSSRARRHTRFSSFTCPVFLPSPPRDGAPERRVPLARSGDQWAGHADDVAAGDRYLFSLGQVGRGTDR